VATGLRWTILSNANLAEAALSRSRLGGTVLKAADLRLSDLPGARLVMTDLRAGNLAGANLRGASLINASLDQANFSSSKMIYTLLGDLDLSGVTGLETALHDGPSTIGIDTIFRSKGKIPEVFLRGAGVPEEFITYMKSLVANPIEFYSCFISYSTKDQEFAERLHGDLQNKNVRCWFAPHDVHGGKKLHEQIDEAIRVHEKVLLILSAESMSSEWVKTEIAKARKREVREKKQVLFPVRLVPFEAIQNWECFDADAGKDSAREIREYFIPDFSEWKEHDKYKKAFERLLGDLKAGGKKVEG
jgi:TIR domain-containing protein/pentapeptide repeat protein